MIGTLTSSITKSVHASISPIFLHQSCSVATPEHPETLVIENCVYVAALTPDMRRVYFYSATEFLPHGSTIEVLLSLILINESYPSSWGRTAMREIVISLVAALVRNSCIVATRIVTSSQGS
jgi:hypothetical protein